MPEQTSLDLLKSIDATLRELLRVLTPASPVHADIDGKYGDPTIKARDPKDWTGESMVGRKFSECPAEYLDLLAERYDYFASREEDAKKAKYNRLDAARARAWAERIRGGWQPPSADPEPFQNNGGGSW